MTVAGVHNVTVSTAEVSRLCLSRDETCADGKKNSHGVSVGHVPELLATEKNHELVSRDCNVTFAKHKSEALCYGCCL